MTGQIHHIGAGLARAVPRSTALLESLPRPVAQLLTMLTYKRPAWSQTEEDFITRFIVPTGAQPDAFGNYWLTVGESPRVLWSSHTDSVHRTEGKQRVLYGDGLATGDNGECLGADCATGVWLMIRMIGAVVPGVYVFHRDEESGGKGATWIARNTPERLAGLDFAIAFDRMDRDEVITHQFGSRTASEAFAVSMCRALAPLPYVPSDGGTFTDTECYAGIISECSNISVGYNHQHRPKEQQDVSHAVALLDRLVSANWETLVCARDPATYGDAWGGGYRWPDDNAPRPDPLDGDTPEELERYVYENPNVVADYLHACGFSLDDLQDFERDQYPYHVAR